MKVASAKKQNTTHSSNSHSLDTDKGRPGAFLVEANSASKTSFFQPKLLVNKVNDPYEAEADRVAEEVTQSIYSERKTSFFPPAPPSAKDANTSVRRFAFFQRKAAFESPSELDQNSANEANIQRKAVAEHISTLGNGSLIGTLTAQRRPAFEGATDVEFNASSSGEVQRSTGSESITASPPPPPIHQQEEEGLVEDSEALLQRKTNPVNLSENREVSADFETRLQGSKGSGKPLKGETKDQMESAFGADFSKVRIHNDSNAERLSDQVSAHAFTHGSDIYFNRGAYQPENKDGSKLLAHELTHVVQQGGATKASVQRSPKVSVSQSAPPMVQRGIIQKARDWAADKANNIPGYAMLTVILGFNPINGRDVPRNAANIFRGIMGFLPGGNLIWEALNNHGIFDKVGGWIVKQLDALGDIGASIVSAFKEFLSSLGWRDAFRLGSVWRRAKRIFTVPIKKIISFVRNLVTDILTFIRDAILRPLAVLAEGTRAWDLLIAVLGENPITGDPVPRTADTLIGGFMKLIGQEEIWENMKKANAVAKGWAWFQSTISQLIALVSSLPGRFISTLKSLTITDLVLVPRAFAKIIKVFATFAFDFISWAGNAVWELLKIIFEVVAPGAMPYLNKAAGAFKSILKNPIGFLSNLVKAGWLGFNMFKNNFFSVLKEVMINWLTGSLAGAGIYIPAGSDFLEILKFILSVLGLTWENIRAKLVEHLGEGPVVVLEEGFELIKLLVTEGPAAVWEKMLEHLSNLKEMVIGEILNWVTKTVVTKAIVKIVSMLNPVGAFVQAIITIWDAIQVFIARLRQIIEVGKAFLNSVMQIANGNLQFAAVKVFETMKKGLVIVVSFLAGFAGLGRISEELQKILKKIRDPIDKAMDSVILWIKGKAQGFLKKKDEQDHAQIIKEAINELQNGPTGDGSYAGLRKAKEQQAKEVEQKHQGKLKEGMKITVGFSDPAKDQEDKDLDVTVTIAPNTSKGKTEIPVEQEEFKLEPGTQYLVKHDVSNAWELGEVGEIKEISGVKHTPFKILSGKKVKGSTLLLPNERLKANKSSLLKDFSEAAKGDSSGPYASLSDPPGVGPFKHFTPGQKAAIIAFNIERNGGKIVSDKSGTILDPTEQRVKGKPVNPNEVNIDHKFPRSKGGWNTYANAEALSFSENLEKSDKI